MNDYQKSKKIYIPREIVFMQAEIDTDSETVLAMMSDNKELAEAICYHRKELEQMGVEVMHRKWNVLVADNGYHFAVFESEIKKGLQ